MRKCKPCNGTGQAPHPSGPGKLGSCPFCKGYGQKETKSDIMKSLGLIKVKGALGGTYYE